MWRVYYLVLRVVSPLALLGLYVYNKLLRRRRARVLLRRDDGRVLLLINALGDQRWSLPGGGVGRQETNVAAAIREVREELRLTLDETRLRALGETTLGGYCAPVFFGQLSEEEVRALRRQAREIRELRWARPDSLPSRRQPLVDWALALVEE